MLWSISFEDAAACFGNWSAQFWSIQTMNHSPLLCFNCLLLTETLQRISCHFFFDVLVFSVQLMSLKLNTSCESFKLKPNEKGLLVWDVCRRWWVKTSQLEATQKYKVKAAEWIRRDSVVVQLESCRDLIFISITAGKEEFRRSNINHRHLYIYIDVNKFKSTWKLSFFWVKSKNVYILLILMNHLSTHNDIFMILYMHNILLKSVVYILIDQYHMRTKCLRQWGDFCFLFKN